MRRRDFNELLGRIDLHLERIDVHIQQTQEVIRESALRQERALQAFEQRLRLMEEESGFWRGRIEAGTEAIWRVLDKWGEGPRPESA